MIPVWLPVVVPWAGAALLAALPRRSVMGGPAVAAVSLAAAVALLFAGGAARPDALGSALLLAGAVSALLAALAGAGAAGRREEGRFFAAGLPVLQGAQALGLLAADAAVAWIGLAIGAGAGAALVALSGGRRAFAAAWRMLLLCGAGLALALLGVALLRVRGGAAPLGLPGLGFMLLLLGYGALAGLAPMHAWLPRTMAAASPPVAAALAGLLLPAALHALLRSAAAAAAAVGPVSGVLSPATLLVSVGAATALLAALGAWRRPRVAGELPGWGASGLAGLAAVGFGLGGAAGTLAGVLLLVGLPFCVGAAVLGAAAGSPVLAALGRVSLAGMPPFAPFAALALVFSAAAALPAGLALPLGAALLAATAAQLGAFRWRTAGGAVPPAPRVGLLVAGPAWLSLFFAFALGVALPEPVAAALAEAARLVR